VVASHGRHFVAEDSEGKHWQVFGKGKRREVAVGDVIQISPSGPEQAWIDAIQERKNLLYRSDALRSKLFAANLDVVILVLAASPPYSPELLGRTLTACENAGIPLEIVFNKLDLVHDDPEFLEHIRDDLDDWTMGEMPIHWLSLTEAPEDARELMTDRLKNKTSLILGQSGMGKSTLINLLIPDAKLATNEVSLALNSGKHTTTNTQMHFGPEGIQVIDSPGFQAFGLHHLDEGDLLNAFPDIKEFGLRCRFDDCKHREEPSCAVKDAIEEGELSGSRFDLYNLLLAELEEARQQY
jgi:ribosome biogenesis GTPase